MTALRLALIGRLALTGASAALVSACASTIPSSIPPRSANAASGYVVQSGDTLSGIAQRYGLQLSEIARANNIGAPYVIRIGDRLTIPGRGAAAPAVSRPVVQPLPGPSLPAPSAPANYPAPASPTTPQDLYGAPRLVWPADGPVTQGFGAGDDPRGIAIETHEGTAVRSAAAGTVIYAGQEPQKYGQLVLVDHGSGWVSAYGHLSRLVVRNGEQVNQNERLGFVGDEGAARTPRLHFELRRDNQPVNPITLFPPKF